MASVLILYSTTDGHTLKICQRMKQVIERDSNQVTLAPIEASGRFDLTSFEKIVLGASIRYGKHSPRVLDFIKRNLPVLESTPNAFFSVSIVARKPEKNRPETNPYLIKFLRQIPWQPQQLAVFAGKLDYPKYRFFDRLMIRFIMLLTKGPTDPRTIIEFTDWVQVEDFARIVNDM